MNLVDPGNRYELAQGILEVFGRVSIVEARPEICAAGLSPIPKEKRSGNELLIASPSFQKLDYNDSGTKCTSSVLTFLTLVSQKPNKDVHLMAPVPKN